MISLHVDGAFNICHFLFNILTNKRHFIDLYRGLWSFDCAKMAMPSSQILSCVMKILLVSFVCLMWSFMLWRAFYRHDVFYLYLTKKLFIIMQATCHCNEILILDLCQIICLWTIWSYSLMDDPLL